MKCIRRHSDGKIFEVQSERPEGVVVKEDGSDVMLKSNEFSFVPCPEPELEPELEPEPEPEPEQDTGPGL